MARIRTIKPEFWEDEMIADLTRDARLLFIATFNLADDEGLLRWTPAFLKSQAFMYDDDLTTIEVEALMAELSEAGLIVPFLGGRSHLKLGWLLNFHKHQRVNRPQPSKFPAPSLQDWRIRWTYARRDGYRCHLCGYPVNKGKLDGSVVLPEELSPSPDHLVPQSLGGGDHPSNIKTAHLSCNKGRGAKPIEEFQVPYFVRVHFVGKDSVNDSVNESVNRSVNDSLLERKGKGREGNGGGEPTSPPAHAKTRPPRKCQTHLNDPNPPPCGRCADARKTADTWQPPTLVTKTPKCPDHPEQPAGRCVVCLIEAAPRRSVS